MEVASCSYSTNIMSQLDAHVAWRRGQDTETGKGNDNSTKFYGGFGCLEVPKCTQMWTFLGSETTTTRIFRAFWLEANIQLHSKGYLSCSVQIFIRQWRNGKFLVETWPESMIVLQGNGNLRRFHILLLFSCLPFLEF